MTSTTGIVGFASQYLIITTCVGEAIWDMVVLMAMSVVDHLGCNVHERALMPPGSSPVPSQFQTVGPHIFMDRVLSHFFPK